MSNRILLSIKQVPETKELTSVYMTDLLEENDDVIFYDSLYLNRSWKRALIERNDNLGFFAWHDGTMYEAKKMVDLSVFVSNMKKLSVGMKIICLDMYGRYIHELTGIIQRVFSDGSVLIKSEEDGISYMSTEKIKLVRRIEIIGKLKHI